MHTKKETIERLKVPINGDKSICFYCSKCGLLLANGFKRVVIGARGPYVEFEDQNIVLENFETPPQQHVYFTELNSRCDEKVFLYHQRQIVSYADYRVGRYYIAPSLMTFGQNKLACIQDRDCGIKYRVGKLF